MSNYEGILFLLKDVCKDLKDADLEKIVTFGHVFLTPDQGHGNVIKLHDKLYSEFLLDILFLELQFVPHIGVANDSNKIINGKIESIDIVSYENNKVEHIKKIRLLWPDLR